MLHVEVLFLLVCNNNVMGTFLIFKVLLIITLKTWLAIIGSETLSFCARALDTSKHYAWKSLVSLPF